MVIYEYGVSFKKSILFHSSTKPTKLYKIAKCKPADASNPDALQSMLRILGKLKIPINNYVLMNLGFAISNSSDKKMNIVKSYLTEDYR
jgi:hypothetical protein